MPATDPISPPLRATHRNTLGTLLARGVMACICGSTLLLVIGSAGCSPSTIESAAQRQAALASTEAAFSKMASTGEASKRASEAADLDGQQPSNPAATTSLVTGDALVARIDRVLERSLLERELSTEVNAAWQIMHAVICYGDKLAVATPDRGRISALEYAFDNGQINGFELQVSQDVLPATKRRGVKARLEPGSYVGQGHVDQWVAILAMADIPLDRKIQVGEQTMLIEDLVRQAQFDASRNVLDEYSWTLIALTHYFPDESRWTAYGELQVSWELLVEQELGYDIDLSPCGGTHRLAGIVRALQAKERLQLADSPVWDRAGRLVSQLLATAKENRLSDGRLSSFYFIRPGATADISAELSSTGHTFEFVALATEAEALSDAWIALSANRLCELIELTLDQELDCGALYHALNGLKIYRERLTTASSD